MIYVWLDNLIKKIYDGDALDPYRKASNILATNPLAIPAALSGRIDGSIPLSLEGQALYFLGPRLDIENALSTGLAFTAGRITSAKKNVLVVATAQTGRVGEFVMMVLAVKRHPDGTLAIPDMEAPFNRPVQFYTLGANVEVSVTLSKLGELLDNNFQ